MRKKKRKKASGPGTGKGSRRDQRAGENAKQERFLRAVALVGIIRTAAALAKIDRETHYRWMKSFPGYPERFKEAVKEGIEVSTERLEQEADRRAHDGIVEKIFYKGEEIAEKNVYSDTLLMFRLNGLAPDKYKYRQSIEVKGTVQLASKLKDALERAKKRGK